MSVAYLNRRQFLRGGSGFLLALPLLPSLLSNRAYAQARKTRPRFIAMATQHGGVWGRNMYPADAMLTEQVQLYPGHRIRRGELNLGSDGSRAQLSPVLSGASGVFTSSLAAKMNVIRGLDVPFYIAHNTGQHLGNYARNDGNGQAGKNVQSDPRPTIDQVMAWSTSFYDDLSSNRERSIHVGSDGGRAISWGYSNPTAQAGDIQPIPTAFSSRDLFRSIFVPPETQQDSRMPVVDRVFESYRGLRTGAFGDARRLSAKDKQRLDDHMDRLAELERRLNVRASCGEMSEPNTEVTKNTLGYGWSSTDPADMRAVYQTFNDVIVAGMICGTTRIATIQSEEIWSSYPPADWHQQVAHLADGADGTVQQILADAHQVFFESVFLDLISKLDFEEVDGKTYLDNALVTWSQESGMVTHDSITVPVITAGSAAGSLRTGNYVDYRNRDNTRLATQVSQPHQERRPGILYTQWLATMLQAMGVPPSEFERPGEKGYGSPYADDSYGPRAESWPDRLFADASKVVPFLGA